MDDSFQQLDGNLYYNVYQEGIYVGYRYYETRYEDTVLGTAGVGNYDYASTVKYPFGYGLSYTNFAYSNFSAEEKDDSFDLHVTVTNTGDVAGKDVVEAYFQSPYTDYDKENGIEKSAVELCGFDKTKELKPGESQDITISVDKKELRTYDSNNAKTYIMDAGDYYFTAASDVHEALNNILAAKAANGVSVNTAAMTSAGDASFTYNRHMYFAKFDDSTGAVYVYSTDSADQTKLTAFAVFNVTYETTDKGVKCEAQTGYVHAMNGDNAIDSNMDSADQCTTWWNNVVGETTEFTLNDDGTVELALD